MERNNFLSISSKLSGIFLCLVIALPAWHLGRQFPIIGSPVLAILFGLLMAMFPRSLKFEEGIKFTSKYISI